MNEAQKNLQRIDGRLILKAFCEKCVKWYNPKYGTRYDAGNRPRCPVCDTEIVTVEVA